jgi:hypothetical protein
MCLSSCVGDVLITSSSPSKTVVFDPNGMWKVNNLHNVPTHFIYYCCVDIHAQGTLCESF